MLETDILRAGKHDLSQAQKRTLYLQTARRGEHDTILASPPCGTFSRARWANRDGPRPLRLGHCPRGFPWLSGPAKRGVDQANSFIDFCASVLSNHFKQSSLASGLMEHPEDLGAVKSGHHLGSAWQFANIKALLSILSVRWGALAKSDFGAECPKPTRLIGRLGGLHLVFFKDLRNLTQRAATKARFLSDLQQRR